MLMLAFISKLHVRRSYGLAVHRFLVLWQNNVISLPIVTFAHYSENPTNETIFFDRPSQFPLWLASVRWSVKHNPRNQNNAPPEQCHGTIYAKSLKKLRPHFSHSMNGGNYIPCSSDCVKGVLCSMLCADLRFSSFATIGWVLFILDFKLCAMRDTT